MVKSPYASVSAETGVFMVKSPYASVSAETGVCMVKSPYASVEAHVIFSNLACAVWRIHPCADGTFSISSGGHQRFAINTPRRW